MIDLSVAENSIEKISVLHPKSLKTVFKPNSYLMSICSRGQVIPLTAIYPNINLTKSIKNLLVISKITEKMLQKSLGLLL